MSVRQFLDVIPKSVKTVASVIAGGGMLIGLVGALINANKEGQLCARGASFRSWHPLPPPASAWAC